jgi:hypothetical protein
MGEELIMETPLGWRARTSVADYGMLGLLGRVAKYPVHVILSLNQSD